LTQLDVCGIVQKISQPINSLEGIMKEQKSQADLEWERRTLCADESCIGVIGPDGRCKECGKPYEKGR